MAIVAIVFGLLPVFGDRSRLHSDSLRVGRAGVQRTGVRRVQRRLIVTEAALSIIPLVAAGLMLRTFGNLVSYGVRRSIHR